MVNRKIFHAPLLTFMKIIAVNRLQPEPLVIAAAAQFLEKGGVIAHPTETCYGFAVCVAQDTSASLDRLYSLKKMDHTKPISILVHDLMEAQKYGVFTKDVLVFVDAFWPGPLTVIVPRTSFVPSYLNPHSVTIAMRIPSCPVSGALLQRVGALTTTSANISTQPSPYSVAAILKQFLDSASVLRLDCILDGGVLPQILPSTIVDTTVFPWKVVREGAIIRSMVEKYF